jgi:hypothetical protein
MRSDLYGQFDLRGEKDVLVGLPPDTDRQFKTFFILNPPRFTVFGLSGRAEKTLTVALGNAYPMRNLIWGSNGHPVPGV